MDKVASENSALARQILTGIAVSLAASLASYGAYEGIRGLSSKMRDKVDIATSWRKIREKYPELGGDNEDSARRVFDAIYKVAPSVARTPGIVVPLIRQAKEYSTGGLDASTLKSLSDIQKAQMDARQLPLSIMRAFSPGIKPVELPVVVEPQLAGVPF